MKVKIIILALVISLVLLPAFQAQGQIDSKPEILDASQGTPTTGEDYTIVAQVSDSDGIDIVRIYVYFKIFDGVSTPEYPTVFETAPGVYQSTVEVPVNASVMYYTIFAFDNIDNNNNTDVLNKDVEDNFKPLAVATPSIHVDLGIPYQFNGSSSRDNVGIVDYSWSFVHDGVTIALDGAEPVFNFTKYGTYTVTLKVTDADDNFDTVSISVATNDGINPVANPNIAQFEYIGHLIKFDGLNSTDNVGIYEYAWTFYHNGTLIILNGSNPEFIFWEVGEYNVTLTVTDAAGNSDQTSFITHVLHAELIESSELPWWTIGLVLMMLAIIITTFFIFKTSKD